MHDASVLNFSPGTVVIVDDILAGSALASAQVLTELGFKVTELVVIYNYSDGDSVLNDKSALEADGIWWWLEREGWKTML